MAITQISPLSGKHGTLADVRANRASRRWLVKTNSRFDDEIGVLAAGINSGNFPTPFLDFHPTWFGLLCRSLNAEQDEKAPQKWIVTAEYSSEPLSQEQKDSQFVPPINRPAKIRWRKNKYQKAQQKDINGKPYLNSAGDPPDPAVELRRSYPLVAITKNVAFTPQYFLQQGDAINAAPFFIEDFYVDQYQAILDDWDRTDVQSETDPWGGYWEYYVLTWTCELNTQEGWLVNLLDQGYRARRPGGDGVSKYNILDNSTPGQPITSPALLDGNGYQLANPSPDNAVYRQFHGYFEVDFNLFPLT